MVMAEIIPPMSAPCNLKIKINYPPLICRHYFEPTIEFTQGIRIPMVNMPITGARATAATLQHSCRTVPNFSTTNTSATVIKPKSTTVPFMTMLLWVWLKGFFVNGLTKSFRTTTDIEFRAVERVLNPALNTPAINKPGRPG
jgi:hypothetical protein